MNKLLVIKVLIASIISVLILSSCKNSNQKDYATKKYNAISKIPTENGDSVSIHNLMLQNGLKGLSVAVFEDYKIIWADTWGVKYDSVPLDINTAFSTASISKPITATLFAILEEKGLIDLTVPVNNYLKRWKIPVNEFNRDTPVTLEHLLSHTAGTTQHGFVDFYIGDTIPTILESVKGKLPRYNKEIEITFKPGTNWNYSGGGYTIAMMALEDHLGKSLADIAQEYIFTPLNLQHTTMFQPNEEGFLTNVAKAHDENGTVIRTGIPITPQVSASGLWSTPTDMSKFLIEIQKALNGQDSKVISEKVAKRITDILTFKVIGGWSLGWERIYAFGNLDWFSHGGANTGIGGHIYATMKGGKGIVFFGNGPNEIRIPILDKLRDNIIKTHEWKVPLRIEEKQLSKSLINSFKGRYQGVVFGDLISIEEENDKLFIPIFFEGKRNDLIYIGDSTFVIDEQVRKLKFKINNKGEKVIDFAFKSPKNDELAFRKIEGKLPSELALENNYADALQAYSQIQKENPKNPLVQESTINNLGYQQLGEKKYDIAITVFKINTDLYPNSANAFDSLGEAYMLSGDTTNAIKFYKKSLELNPSNTNAIKMIDNMSKL